MLGTGNVHVQHITVHRHQDKAVQYCGYLLCKRHLEHDRVTGGIQHGKAGGVQFIHIGGNEEGRADNDEIQHQDHLSGRHVVVLGPDKRNDIRSSRGPAIGYAHADADTRQQAAHQDAQELAVIDGQRLDDGGGHQPRQETQGDGGQDDGIDGFGAESHSQDNDGRRHQDGIQDKITVTHLDLASRGILDHGADTGHATADEVIGDEEHRPGRHIDEDAQGDQQPLLDVGEEVFLENRHSYSVISSF